MRIAYSRPTDFAVAVVGPGAALLTDPADLFNGRPLDATVLRLPSDWVGATTDVVHLQFTRATPFNAGLIGLVGANFLSLASSAGIKMGFTGRRIGDAGFTYALGGNTALVRSVEVGDGSIKSLGLCGAGLDDLIGFQLSIWNDQNGASPLVASGFVHLGEPWASPTLDVYAKKGREIQFPDDNAPASVGDQPWPTPYPPGRVLPLELPFVTRDEVFSSTSGGGPNFHQLRRLLGNGKVSIFIPEYLDDSGAVDVALMHQSAMFGMCRLTKIAHQSGDRWTPGMTIKEVPALLAE